MKTLAIIPARGGSKRIPRKNIKEFCGFPIIKYSIDAALRSGCFDEVMVSTDDDEIASIAKKYGAKVPFLRSKEASCDDASTKAVIKEVLLSYKKMGLDFDHVCCIYPAAPFVTDTLLNQVRMIWPENENKRSQELEASYHDVGQFYWIRITSFLKKNSIFTDNTMPFELPEIKAQDIDTEQDWKIAETKYRILILNKDNA
ncbi:MAG: pseudaminic acid cytidylyltransferase [Proteobacteria bacterium]|nr:pseudaminic acid cytidylyltransferase [Pseudomonadota bacterium]